MIHRTQQLRSMKPELIADLWLYPTEAGGRRAPIKLGWGCPCSVRKTTDDCCDGYPLLGDQEMKPGESMALAAIGHCLQTLSASMSAAPSGLYCSARYSSLQVVV